MPHRTIIDPHQQQIQVLNQALKHAIITELQHSQSGIFEHKHW
jgi:hypothetical protein